MRDFMNNLRYRASRRMYGRYGGRDALNAALIGLALLLELLFMIFQLPSLSFIALIPIVFSIVRTFSRNTAKCYEQNRKFTNFFKNLASLRKYHIYRCPQCRQKIRVPRKGGKNVEITCPKCGERFRKKI